MSMPVAPEPKGQQISHSTVEKQRRDRINSLIDEVCRHGARKNIRGREGKHRPYIQLVFVGETAAAAGQGRCQHVLCTRAACVAPSVQAAISVFRCLPPLPHTSIHVQLRELVPPQQRGGANGGAGAAGNDPGGLEARRPKHVVLADTIQLLKHLQLKVGG